MKTRLSPDAKNQISDKYSQHPIYRLIEPTALQYECQLGTLRLGAEEVFCHCIRTIDRLKQHPTMRTTLLENLWNQNYTSLQRLSPEASETEKQQGATLLTFPIALCLSASPLSDSLMLSGKVLGPILAHHSGWSDISQSYSKTLHTLSEELTQHLSSYFTSDETLSVQIDSLCTGSIRIIDSQALFGYFKNDFKGIGRGAIFNYFEKFIPLLQRDRTVKDFAYIAHMVFVSRHKSDIFPKKFTDWYRIFCKAVGCPYNKDYKPGKLNHPPQSLRDEFYMLK